MVQQDYKRHNNFGTLRLLFSTLVILSHSPEIITGDRSREILTQIFGTISFGELAVDAFFIISGYLISQSFQAGGSIWHYFLRRFARIVPGYAVCFILCILIVAPIAGGDPTQPAVLLHNAVRLITLGAPDVPGVFEGMEYPALNGSMWTISFEFRCYLAVIALGLLGLFTVPRRFILLGMTVLFLLLNVLHPILLPDHLETKLRFVTLTIRLTGFFLCGSTFYAYRQNIPLRHSYAFPSAILLVLFLFNPMTAEVAVGVFGSYLIFWFTFALPQFRLSAAVDRFDISYGIYLYAWPVQICLVWWGIALNPWFNSLLSLAIVVPLAAMSWLLVEKPGIKLISPRKRQPD